MLRRVPLNPYLIYAITISYKMVKKKTLYQLSSPQTVILELESTDREITLIARKYQSRRALFPFSLSRWGRLCSLAHFLLI